MNAIFTRRSIRKYTAEPVSQSDIKMLLKAGMAAPSAFGRAPWHFVVIKNRALLDQIPTVHPYTQMCKQAPIAICVCYDKRVEASKDWFMEDLSAAAQNILLEATTLGLGAVWCGVYAHQERVEAITRILSLPDHLLPFALIPVGHPDEKKEGHSNLDADKYSVIE